MSDHIIVEELTFKPVGDSHALGFKPIRITVNGKRQPPVFDAREIAAIKSAASAAKSN